MLPSRRCDRRVIALKGALHVLNKLLKESLSRRCLLAHMYSSTHSHGLDDEIIKLVSGFCIE